MAMIHENFDAVAEQKRTYNIDRSKLRPDHLTQYQMDGVSMIRDGNIITFLPNEPKKRLNIKLSRFALQRNNLIPRSWHERINHNLIETVLAARQATGGYELVGTSYVKTSPAVVIKPTLKQRILDRAGLVQFM